MKRTSPRACPCHSGLAYDACCAPFHRGEREAPSAVALMRSRYAAFALGDAGYLIHTLHTHHADRDATPAALARSLHADRRRYPSLAILDERTRGKSAEVLFAAGITESGRDVSFVELSDFERDAHGWRYLSGVMVPLAELGRSADGLTIDDFLAIAADPRGG
jgi:SEC-C motif-containing protein